MFENEPHKTVHMRTSLPSDKQETLDEFLRINKDLCILYHEDMPSIDLENIVDRLNVNLNLSIEGEDHIITKEILP